MGRRFAAVISPIRRGVSLREATDWARRPRPRGPTMCCVDLMVVVIVIVVVVIVVVIVIVVVAGRTRSPVPVSVMSDVRRTFIVQLLEANRRRVLDGYRAQVSG